MWEILHLHKVRRVFVVPTVSVNKALVRFYFARLHVLEDVNVAFVC